jgi:hypothetical protein
MNITGCETDNSALDIDTIYNLKLNLIEQTALQPNYVNARWYLNYL